MFEDESVMEFVLVATESVVVLRILDFIALHLGLTDDCPANIAPPSPDRAVVTVWT